MQNELTETETGAVPSWMRDASAKANLGNVDASDMKPPRLKILAGQSPEIMDGIPGAQVGQFWMTILNKNLGPAVSGSLILVRKSYHIWAPKMAGSEQKGPLATASDGINWDTPNQTFQVKFPAAMGGGEETWKIGRTVFDTGAHKFGTQRPDDPKSKPIATLTYDMLWSITVEGKRQLCVFTAARTGATPTQNFISTVKAKGAAQFFQNYRIVSVKKSGPTGDPYFTFDYQFVGMIEDEALARSMMTLYEQYSKSGFVTDIGDEAADIKTERRTEGTHSDVVDDDIPF